MKKKKTIKVKKKRRKLKEQALPINYDDFHPRVTEMKLKCLQAYQTLNGLYQLLEAYEFARVNLPEDTPGHNHLAGRTRMQFDNRVRSYLYNSWRNKK